MFMNMDPKSNKKRDGRHCDLCGCSFPAVRCDKCNSQIFCLSCDDMYHRHPKRRFHLRKAVDPTPTPLARPVLPMKVSNLPVAPGDPSKMPLPPPRKKKSSKSIFDTFRKGSPASDTSPTLPKKEYSWSNKFGSIKKFMSQRPLPPVPDNGSESFAADGTVPLRDDFSFIHSRGEEKPPALPQRNQPKPAELQSFQKYSNGNAQDMVVPQENGYSREEHSRGTINESTNRWSNGIHQNNPNENFQRPMLNSENIQDFGTIRRQSQPVNSALSSQLSRENVQSGMHSSSSATDLHALSSMVPNPGMPAYPQYPFNPHMTPQYQGPFPMYPQYPVYPQYFGNSWANLSSPVQTTDGDFSDQSENSSLHFQHMRNAAYKDKKAKRSHSVVVDRMPYQGQFYPYGPFPSGGFPPPTWIPGHHVKDTPPSPATSLRSLSRLSQSQRRKQITDEDEEDEDGFSSSSLSRPKSSSSEVSKLPRQVRKPSCPSSSSDEEVEKDRRRAKSSPSVEKRQLKHEMLKRRVSSPRQSSAARESPHSSRRHSADSRKPPKVASLKADSIENSENSEFESTRIRVKNKNVNPPSEKKDHDPNKEGDSSWTPKERWYCKHCTFLNEPGERICRVCCKTVLMSDNLPKETLQSVVENNADSNELLNDNKGIKETVLFNEKRDMALLNSALDEAEKEITRSLDELLKIKEESNEQEEDSHDVKCNHSVTQIKNSTPPVVEQNASTLQESENNSVKASISEANRNSASSQSYIDNNEVQQTNGKVITPETAQKRILSKSPPACSHHSIKGEMEPVASVDTTDSEFQTRKDSFCQTYQDVVLPEFSTEDKNNVRNTNCVHLVEKSAKAQSPPQYDYPDRGVHGLFGLHRAHSRASLFGGRLSDASPVTHEYLFPSSMYRSLSRTSLLGDTEGWTSDYYSRHKPDFYLSMEELVERRRQESMRAQGLELVRMIREAEQQGFTADDIQVALNNCGKENPVNWLQENWKSMIHTVMTLATNYGRDKKENDVGGISQNEARDALRLHKGNIWAAVTECVEGRQRKLLELSARGNFTFSEIIDALTLGEGNVEMAYSELTKTSLKPFLMRVWGSGEGVQNLDAAEPFHYQGENPKYLDEIKFSEAVASDDSISGEDIWEYEDYEDQEWEENEQEKLKEHGIENKVEVDEQSPTLLTSGEFESDEPEEVKKPNTFASLLTPESDKSEYCDAIGSASSELHLSSTSIDEIYLLSVDEGENFEQEPKNKGTGFLKKLANLKRSTLSTLKDLNNYENDAIADDNTENYENNSLVNAEQIKTIETDAKKIEPVGNSKKATNFNLSSKKSPSLSEKRTIIVRDKIATERLPSGPMEDPLLQTILPGENLESVALEVKTGCVGLNFRPNVDFVKTLEDKRNTHNSPVPVNSVNILNCDVTNINNQNDEISHQYEILPNETNRNCIPLEANGEIAEQGNEMNRNFSEFSDLLIIKEERHSELRNDTTLQSGENNVTIFQNELNEHGEITVKNKTKSIDNTLQEKTVKLSVGKKSIVRADSINSENDGQSAKEYHQQIDTNNEDLKITSSQQTFAENTENATINDEGKGCSFMRIIDPSTEKKVILDKEKDSASTEMINLKTSEYFPLNENNSVQKVDGNERKESIIDNETDEKGFISLAEESAVVIAKANEYNLNSFENVASVQNIVQSDKPNEASISSAIVQEIESRDPEAANEEQGCAFDPTNSSLACDTHNKNTDATENVKSLDTVNVNQIPLDNNGQHANNNRVLQSNNNEEKFNENNKMMEARSSKSPIEVSNKEGPHIETELENSYENSNKNQEMVAVETCEEILLDLEPDNITGNKISPVETSCSDNQGSNLLVQQQDMPDGVTNEKAKTDEIEGNSVSKVSKTKGKYISKTRKLKEETISEFSKIKEKNTMNVEDISGPSKLEDKNVSESVSKNSEIHTTLPVSEITEPDNVLKTDSSKSIPKLPNESQPIKNDADEQSEAILPDLYNATESSGENNSTDMLPSPIDNEFSNLTENSQSNFNSEITNPNLTNSSQNNSAGSNVPQIMPTETIDSNDVHVGNTQISSLAEETDTVENEESSNDNYQKSETEPEGDVNTDVNLLNRPVSPIRPIGHLRRMSFNTRKEAIILERAKDLTLTKIGESKPWFLQKKVETFKPAFPKRSIKQQLEFERRVRTLVADRKCRTYRKAEIIVQLQDMNFDETESIEAANECSTLEQAISFLQQECQLCAGAYPIREIISMVHCSHRACRECIKAYFTIQIRDRTIMELLCPFCNEPDITDEDVAQDYFNHLDIMLKKLVEEDIHELFQRKLRDRVLMRDPNFRWCTQCSSGFIADPYLKRLICPDCKAIMCASCRRLWERDHEGITCEDFAAFKDSMDPQFTGIAKLLTENGIDCPSCHFKYALAKGGCMHFKCIQCQHDFCSGCSRPFKMGQKCGVSEFCAKLGLHAHHPRNCLFYLRDKEPDDLQKLLDMNDIKYDKDQPDGTNNKKSCQVMEQKETAHGMIDDVCGKEVQDGFAGLCRLHYVEYLGQMVNKHKIDPVQIFDNDDLELVLKRASLRMPPRKYRETPDDYRDKLLQVIEEKLPLAEVDGS